MSEISCVASRKVTKCAWHCLHHRGVYGDIVRGERAQRFLTEMCRAGGAAIMPICHQYNVILKYKHHQS